MKKIKGITFESKDIPEELLEKSNELREEMLEAAAEASEELMDEYLDSWRAINRTN